MDRDEYVEYLKKMKDISLSELRNKLVGRKVILKENLADIYSKVGVLSVMRDFGGKVVTINSISEGNYYLGEGGSILYRYFTIDEYGCSWEFNMIEAILDDILLDTTSEQEVDLEIKKGDLVKIKEYNEKDTVIGDLYGIPIVKNFQNMQNEIDVPKKEFVVADIVGNTILPYYFDDKYKNYIIDKSRLELVREGYVDKVKSKKRKLAKETKMLEDLEIMEEMKSKVNIKDFKKIYAGSLRAKPNNLKGIELLLHQWAFNKKHLYKLLGNELSITKEIEYIKTEEDMKGEKEELYKEFPVACYVLDTISNEEFLKNKTIQYYERQWCRYKTGGYSSGTKVSKILNDAFSNDALNTYYSDIVAQSKITGIIEISINPIEILLMSTNVSGWNSCHKINDMESPKSWGCYSGGIFSYMCDSTSMIAFRHNNKLYDFQIYNSKTQQHSKNWRQMIWINKDFTEFITSRQYPCKMEEITKQVREMLEEKINAYTGEFTWVHSDNQSKIRDVIIDYRYNNSSSNVLHYNDMLNGYSGDLCYKKDEELSSNSIKVGSNPVCPLCGIRILKNCKIPFCMECKNIVDRL